jgi:hypothetical protein
MHRSLLCVRTTASSVATPSIGTVEFAKGSTYNETIDQLRHLGELGSVSQVGGEMTSMSVSAICGRNAANIKSQHQIIEI